MAFICASFADWVPSLGPVRAVHWPTYCGTTAGHLARAALEGIAFQVADVLDVMRDDSNVPMNELRVDGGAARNNLLMQFQSDILQIPVVRPEVTETTALGAAFLAGLTVGFWKNAASLNASWKVDRRFEPQMSPDQAKYRRGRWEKALRRACEWEEPG